MKSSDLVKNVPVLRFREFSGEWEGKRLGEMTKSIKSGKTKPCKKGTYPVYGSTGIIGKSEKYTHDSVFILIARVGANAGKLNYVNGKLSVTDNTLILDSNEKIDKKFSLYLLIHSNLNRLIFGSGQPLITGKVLKKLKISLPNLPEQQKIANFLTSIDTKLQQLRERESLLKSYKTGCLQQIFSQEIRFKKDNGEAFEEWKERKLEHVLLLYKKRTIKNNEYEVFTSSRKGLILQKEYFGKNRITERNNQGFNIVPTNFITYRSRSDNRFFKFNLNNTGIIGCISTYYPVFNTKECVNRFVVDYLNFNRSIFGKISEGTSQTVLSFNLVKSVKLKLPSLLEQQKIANFLTSIDKRITTVSEQIAELEAYKRGLLQQMFV